ncbi:MAG: tripartite tricarboxylate transporter substrate binding protein [Burkholderiaceae bacterium]|nr:tripartite tricarboxylate transporter substrate binding protein [Burkholderiaceae bacterium]MCD8516938.1 tripartite tricarboxylate transporter substrate binding protein [Burkholderiaceae bacterium]MCD8536772.1 tripartite tricarboxylate transporter substrate binding protein [Burkholderiaceae bacterium]
MLKAKFLTAAASIACAGLMATTANAAAPNCSTAQLVVPWAAGGDTDIVFRLYVETINKTGIKPQLQVVNVAGQGGIQGAAQVKDAKPDGCSIIALHESVITSFLTGRAKFNHEAFEPVAVVSFTPSIVGSSTKAPFKSLSQMIAMSKEKPESVTVGVTLGSTSHFIFLLLEDAAGIKLRYVSYDGTRERNTALLSGNVMMGETNVLSAKQYIEEGTLLALGIATEERDPVIPMVQTLKEQGVNVLYGLTRGVALPKGTPADIVKFWEDAFVKAAQDPALVKAIEEKGSVVMSKGSKGYSDFLNASYAEHERLAIQIGMYKK